MGKPRLIRHYTRMTSRFLLISQTMYQEKLFGTFFFNALWYLWPLEAGLSLRKSVKLFLLAVVSSFCLFFHSVPNMPPHKSTTRRKTTTMTAAGKRKNYRRRGSRRKEATGRFFQQRYIVEAACGGLHSKQQKVSRARFLFFSPTLLLSQAE